MKRTQKRKGTKPNAERRRANRLRRRHMAIENWRLEIGCHGNPAHIFQADRRDRKYRKDPGIVGKGRNPKKTSAARRVRPHYHYEENSFVCVRDDGARVERVRP
jgi:hypothetical protein